ncbi:response regulator [Paenibacillus sp. HWE-109]|uniref:response regulator n=1 Tax=Paenibacillus sp. HWE-109 TaxID=1306526 RepID=UPI001EDCC385|nr:response regulator [Paenibacillus sp. HWE-109]UKS28150.1 response regulator [Paenibacillus sp. HWE-109]
MKKILLVDDEILIREIIRDSIDWEKEGFIYSGDASDGEVALPIIERVQPDILITDILMPFMNGLELSSIMSKQFPDMKIIIISGHAEFEYARSAMQIGVQEYCLKPISPTELLKVLHKVSAEIDKEREISMQLQLLKAKEYESSTISQDKLLNDLCSGFMTTSEVMHHSASIQLNIIAHYYVVTVLDLRETEADKHEELNARHDNERLLLDKCSILKENYKQLMFQRSRTESVWIIKGDTLENLKLELQLFQDLQKAISEEAHSLPISIGIGSVQDRLQKVHISFLDAMEDVHWRRLSRQNRNVLSEMKTATLDPTLFLDRGAFMDFLKIGSHNKLSSFVADYAAALVDINWHTTSIGFYILNDVTIEAFRSNKDMYRHLTEPEKALQQFQQMIGNIRTWEETCSYLIHLIEQFWTWRSRIYDKYSDMIAKVKEYIQLNFEKDNFSLQDSAEYVNLSPNYLSRVFSQETSQTFIEYLTQVRIRKAMDLLKSTSAKSYEIAFLVGYNDPHYFSNLFKRLTGMTPKEFRKNGTADEALDILKGDSLHEDE